MKLSDRLKAGAEAGIISAEQAKALDVFITEKSDFSDAESVHFARGFHDIFLSLGIIILLVGVSTSAALIIEDYAGFVGAGLAWLLAEFYTRSRNLVLPSIVLSAAFVLMTAYSTAEIIRDFMPGLSGSGSDLLFPLVALAASSFFLARFRLPFAYGLVAASASAVLISTVTTFTPNSYQNYDYSLSLMAGLICFSCAMMFDLADPKRESLKADNAFWLHLCAAPLIVHSATSKLADIGLEMSKGQAFTILAVLTALGFVALVIDRRAILVSGLAYLGIAIAALFSGSELHGTEVTGITLLLLGAAIVALGTGWRTARRIVIDNIIPARLSAHLPIIRAGSNE
jgi:hypothetical protein